MSSTESFDELEQKISGLVEDALAEVKEDFLERLQSARERLEEMASSELANARQEAAAAESVAVEAEEARAALLAEAEEAKVAAIAAAIEAKESEFAEAMREKDEAIAAAQEAREAALAEATEAKEAEIAEAIRVKDEEVAETIRAKDEELTAAEEAKTAAVAEIEETREAAVAEAVAAGEAALAEAEAASREALTSAVQGALRQLREAVGNIDRATSQSEVLEAFLTASAAYAWRSALFLTREDGLQGWGGQGFDAAEGSLQEVHMDYTEGSSWAELAAGRGSVELSRESCAELCSAIDGSQPRGGVLVPMVLRDRLAAAFYADSSEERELDLVALQILTYVAAQALETLPLREGASSATLRLATEAPAEEPGLELWQFLAPPEPIEAFVPEEPEPVPVPAEPEALEAEVAEEWAAEEPVPEEVTPQFEPEPVEETWEEPIEVPPEPEPAGLVEAEESGFAVEEVMAEPEPIPVEEISEPAPAEELEPTMEKPLEEPSEVSPPIEVAPPTAVPPPTAVVPPPAPTAGAEVAPPEDVDGPGWAFTTRRFTGETGEDASHEEARRLARLLVTEIKLYNEEQVEEGRRGRNIYRALKEDIDRSRQIYDERIAEAVRAETDYFHEEMVRILAAGDAEVLGI